MHIPVFGNGDVDTPEKAMLMRDKFGLDGAMIGRASIGNPWFFNQVKHFFETGTHAAPPTMQQRVEAARRHLEMAIGWKGEVLGVFETRRHYTNYFKGIPHFKEYRMKMVYSHFPIQLKLQGNRLEIANFLGEKKARYARIEAGVTAKIASDEVVLSGIDRELVGTSAANIEHATHIRDRDPRVFQDGIYIIQRG